MILSDAMQAHIRSTEQYCAAMQLINAALLRSTARSVNAALGSLLLEGVLSYAHTRTGRTDGSNV